MSYSKDYCVRLLKNKLPFFEKPHSETNRNWVENKITSGDYQVLPFDCKLVDNTAVNSKGETFSIYDLGYNTYTSFQKWFKKYEEKYEEKYEKGSDNICNLSDISESDISSITGSKIYGRSTHSDISSVSNITSNRYICTCYNCSSNREARKIKRNGVRMHIHCLNDDNEKYEGSVSDISSIYGNNSELNINSKFNSNLDNIYEDDENNNIEGLPEGYKYISNNGGLQIYADAFGGDHHFVHNGTAESIDNMAEVLGLNMAGFPGQAQFGFCTGLNYH